MAHFFTADTHFADDPVRRFFARPFETAAGMDNAMIARDQISPNVSPMTNCAIRSYNARAFNVSTGFNLRVFSN